MDEFTYQPIDLDRPAVRLVRLFKGYMSDEIQCELFDGWIDQFDGGVPYEALSYTWGGTEKAAKIKVNGSTMHVTTNLFEALQHLRFEDEDRILWIDAICINQDNPHERTHQVQHMGHIYKEAEQVVIWLGQCTEEIDFVMDSIKQLHENNVKVDGDWRRLAHHWIDHLAVVQPNQEDVNRWRRGMELILKRPWFSRVWILQEIANARVAKVICGKRSVSARTFAQFPTLIRIEPNPRCQAILDLMPGLSRKESWWSEKRDLHTLLVKFRGSLATDERDIVYALLGISLDACGCGVLQPEYIKPVKQVIRDTVSFLLSEINQDRSFYKFLDWTMSEFLQNLDSLNAAVFKSAVDKGQEVAVKILLAKYRAQANWKDKIGRTVLHQEVQSGNEAAVKLLIENGIELETKDSDGQTSLSLAIKKRNEAIVQLLIEGGAEIESKDIDGRTPLLLAIKGRNIAITRLLIERGADIEAKDNSGRTSLLLAVQKYDEIITRLLIKNGADIKTKDFDGQTPIMWIKNSDSRTPLVWNGHEKKEAIAKLLLEKGFDLEKKDNNGRTSPSLGATKADEDIAQVLPERDTNRETTNNNGQTPLMNTTKRNHKSAVQLLRDLLSRKNKDQKIT